MVPVLFSHKQIFFGRLNLNIFFRSRLELHVCVSRVLHHELVRPHRVGVVAAGLRPAEAGPNARSDFRAKTDTLIFVK